MRKQKIKKKFLLVLFLVISLPIFLIILTSSFIKARRAFLQLSVQLSPRHFQCVIKRGEWRRCTSDPWDFWQTHYECYFMHPTAGKPCSSGNDCQKYCLIKKEGEGGRCPDFATVDGKPPMKYNFCVKKELPDNVLLLGEEEVDCPIIVY